MAGSHSRASDEAHLGWDLRSCICRTFPVMLMLQGPHLENHWPNRFSLGGNSHRLWGPQVSGGLCMPPALSMLVQKPPCLQHTRGSFRKASPGGCPWSIELSRQPPDSIPPTDAFISQQRRRTALLKFKHIFLSKIQRQQR